MKKIVLSGHIDVLENELAVITQALEAHRVLTRQEPGCILFEVTQCQTHSTRFHVYEEFIDRQAFESHQARVKASYWGQVTENVSRCYRIEERSA
ncbi:putative quinol monooxygenase [Vibrio ostreicida]|uniref:Antibiotic biosynthesis monooxygenase n=1 Tax=Vibrio ostreicida TaxID=526588 RepID=A0ABT8BX82_9VIBR|nr:antibiotic biosynthesis monooxygenase [Vibrio ostreicida]MDN3611656.1 antibiotic biosynthesis monooxygenase [Vibrio ostreicida]NPD10144.1 antibiotic biosynthesis monooxygenase [Vibrio ostreicida]